MTSSISNLHFNRQCGLHQSPAMREEAMERRRADHIARDVFHAFRIDFPQNCDNRISSKGDWLTVISKTRTQEYVYRLAL